MVSRDSRLIHLMAAYGLENGASILAASRKVDIPLSVLCAMFQSESGGRNIFGADPAGNALPSRWFDTPVSYWKFQYFWRRVHKGYTSNGVGPSQLTSPGLIQTAQNLGGAWKVLPNMIAGARALKDLYAGVGSSDWRLAFQHYNGSGPAAEAYGYRTIEHQRAWHSLFERNGLT